MSSAGGEGEEKKGKCPVNHAEFMKNGSPSPFHHPSNASSTSASKPNNQTTAVNPANGDNSTTSNANPANTNVSNSNGDNAANNANLTSAKSGGIDGCPVHHAGNKTAQLPQRKVYNVYGQLIDPTNQMPANANQEPAPGQRIPLSKERIKSNIPKGGTDNDSWLYPSPQMFYNALRRKGKDDGFKEEDADLVVAIHNNMNEKTWRKVMEWESQYCEVCPAPTLLKFMGRPDELSPKARLKTWFGWISPFDRHDWYIDRCGKEVRYIIDYYYDEASAKQDEVPSLQSTNSIKSIHVDVRPALDSFGSFSERITRFYPRLREAMEEDRSKRFNQKRQDAARLARHQEVEHLKNQLDEMQAKCSKRIEEVQKCQGEADCEKAAIGLNYCMAQCVCQNEARDFIAAMQAPGNEDEVHEKVTQAMWKMTECLRLFGIKAGRDLRASRS